MNAETPVPPLDDEDDREPDELYLPAEASPPVDKGIRLQRFLAMAGCGPRRQCEEFIQDGRVTVAGKTITELGFRVERTHHVKLDGERIRLGKRVYYILNKPMGYLCTNRDPIGRPRAVDLIPKQKERLFTVGRLDENSQGLLLVTNDGDMAHHLAHPRFSVRKVYRVQVVGVPDREILKKLKEGMYFAEGVFRVADVELKKAAGTASVLDIVLTEGQNREIRRLMAKLGHKVQRLNRIALGPLKLGDLPVGAYRPLSNYELGELHDLIEEAGAGTRKSARKRGTRGTVEVSAARKAADDRKLARESATRRERGAGGTRGKARSALNRATGAKARAAAKAAAASQASGPPSRKPQGTAGLTRRPSRRDEHAAAAIEQVRPSLDGDDDDFSGERTPKARRPGKPGEAAPRAGRPTSRKPNGQARSSRRPPRRTPVAGSTTATKRTDDDFDDEPASTPAGRHPAQRAGGRPVRRVPVTGATPDRTRTDDDFEGEPTSRKPGGHPAQGGGRRPARRVATTGARPAKPRTDGDFDGQSASGRKPGGRPSQRAARRPTGKVAGKSGKGKPRRPRP